MSRRIECSKGKLCRAVTELVLDDWRRCGDTLSCLLRRWPRASRRNRQRSYRGTGWMRGVNLSGAELNSSKTRLNFDYIYPTTAEIDYFVGKGLTTFRIPVLSDRLLGPSREGPRPLTRDWIALLRLIDHAARSHARVIVDFHQYGAMPSA